jgi:hypothetical protein
MKTKLIIAILLFVSLQTAAQSVYNYRIKEYFEYNNSKKVLIKVSTENVGTSLTVNDQKKEIIFKINGIEEVAKYDKLIVKGLISLNKGKPYLHYIYYGQGNDQLHFYISKESAKIEALGAMLVLKE